jgi:cytochrome c oxidase subunit II
MCRNYKQLLLLGGVFLSSLAVADQELAPLTEPAVYISCISCHGPDGLGSEAIHAPPIAGQRAAYLEAQLLAFRSGERGGHNADIWARQMALMSKPLADSDISSLAFFLSQQPRWAVPAVKADQTPTGFTVCGSCHGEKPSAAGDLDVPQVWGMPSEYLFRQLIAYRDGIRGHRASEGSPNVMSQIMNSSMTDKMLSDFADYLASGVVSSAAATAATNEKQK